LEHISIDYLKSIEETSMKNTILSFIDNNELFPISAELFYRATDTETIHNKNLNHTQYLCNTNTNVHRV
jgi:hypothetical protein